MSSEVFYSRLNLKHCIILLHTLSKYFVSFSKVERLLFLDTLIFLLDFLQLSFKCCSVKLRCFSLNFNLFFYIILLCFVPIQLFYEHLLIYLSPLSTELKKLVYLSVVKFHFTIFALAYLLSSLRYFFRAVSATTSRAIDAMVFPCDKCKFFITQLTIRFVLIWSWNRNRCS